MQAIQPSAGLVQNFIILGKAEPGPIFPAIIVIESLSRHAGDARLPKQIHRSLLAILPRQPAYICQDVIGPLGNVGSKSHPRKSLADFVPFRPIYPGKTIVILTI